MGTAPSSRFAGLEAFLAAQGQERLDWRYKGFGALATPSIDQVRAEGLPLSALGTPMMTIDIGAVADNLLSMAAWCSERGVTLAPHGKTTMAPVLWLGQLMAGCTAITVANGSQLRAARAFGVTALQLANELLDPADVAWVAAELAADPVFTFLSWVDSVAAVERMSAAVTTDGPPIPVCVEVGAAAGRTGARTAAAALEVAAAVRAAPRLALAGVAGYEGAVPGAAADGAGLQAVDDFLRLMLAVHQQLDGGYETERITLTAGGSAYFDRVAAVLGPFVRTDGTPVDVVLRSGAYVVHDDLHYSRITPSTRSAGPTLRSAIHVWASVLSRPEHDLVIIDAGRRDLPFDIDLPVVLAARRNGADPQLIPVNAHLTALNDQHAFVRIDSDSPLQVGDVLKLGLSHPCTAFDKWRAIPMVDSADAVDPRVTDVALTYF
jgi:D-serine deaminase-like pyridoxal phosphate-dependent protein